MDVVKHHKINSLVHLLTFNLQLLIFRLKDGGKNYQIVPNERWGSFCERHWYGVCKGLHIFNENITWVCIYLSVYIHIYICNCDLISFKSLWPDDAIWHKWTGLSLVHGVACRQLANSIKIRHFSQGNAFENVISRTTAILFSIQCIRFTSS